MKSAEHGEVEPAAEPGEHERHQEDRNEREEHRRDGDEQRVEEVLGEVAARPRRLT